MDFQLGFLSGGCYPEDWAISTGNELYENGVGLGWDPVVGDILVPLPESSEEDRGELPIRTRRMIPTLVREYTRKAKGKEKVIANEEKRPPSLVGKFRYWQDKEPLCQDICVSIFPIA